MRSAAHHKPMAKPVPQMIGVPSHPKRGPSSPTIQAPTAPPFPSGNTEPGGKFSPQCGQGQGAHHNATRPDPDLVGLLSSDGLNQQHDAPDHSQPHTRSERAEQPSGQQRAQAAHGILDVFPFIGRSHEF